MIFLMYADGDSSVDFLKKRLKADFELKPQSISQSKEGKFLVIGN